MQTRHHLIKKFKNQRGAVVIIVAIMLFFFLIGIMALAIDVGYFYATKNELQSIADAAALAGAGKLGDIYTSMPVDEQDTHDFEADRPAILASAREVVRDDESEDSKNPAGGKDIIKILSTDIQIGNWDPSADPKFNPLNSIPIGAFPDAVKVTVRRDDSANDPITTFFGIIFGKKNQDVTADAVAALTTITDVGPGELKIPVGIAQTWLEPTPNCKDTISFSPTSTCAGWHNFFNSISGSALDNKLIGLIRSDPLPDEEGNPGECLMEPCGNSNPDPWLDYYFDMLPNQVPPSAFTPATGEDDAYFFQGGDIASLFIGGYLAWEDDNDRVTPIYNDPENENSGQKVIGDEKHPAPFFAIFDYFRFRDGYPLPEGGLSVDTDDDGIDDLHITDPDTVWTGTIPVYEDSNCINPNQTLKIIGFAIVHVVLPELPPQKKIIVKIDCELTFIKGIGGGGTSGFLRGSIPNLVE